MTVDPSDSIGGTERSISGATIQRGFVAVCLVVFTAAAVSYALSRPDWLHLALADAGIVGLWGLFLLAVRTSAG
ncbi:MAG: hypothetical protein ABEI77_08300 [Halorientalis sp.]